MRMVKAEKHYADTLKEKGIEYNYPVQPFQLTNTKYRPDFYLPESKTYVEVVGMKQAYKLNEHKYKMFRELYPDLNFIVVDKWGNNYYEMEQINKERKERGLKLIKKSYGVDYTIKGIDENLWLSFKVKCIENRIPMKDKILELIADYVKGKK